MNRCLNRGADLHGAFCADCGQRAVPANPTIAELAGDAWQELSGYDGRIAATFKGLLRPGLLTVDYLQGRRARYLSPIRLYLIVSVVYFLASAAAPVRSDIAGPGIEIQFGNASRGDAAELTAEDRAAMLETVDQQAWFIRPLLRSFAQDPAGFRARIFTIMPRVFFGLLPVFAAIVAMFYRGHRFPTALVYSAHLHAFAFVTFTVSEVAKYARQPVVTAVVGAACVAAFIAYTLWAFRAVYRETWPMTALKTVGVGVVYVFASIPAFILILVWASLT